MFYEDNHIRIFNQDCRTMDDLPDESVQCVVTSPPYWGLRKYSGEQDLVWGRISSCVHEWGKEIKLGEGYSGSKRWKHLGGRVGEEQHWDKSIGSTSFCSLCGAWRGAYGLEPTPELYVQHTVEILRGIRRVLRKDGVVFWNIGDSYASGKGTCYNPGGGRGSYNAIATRKSAGAYPLNRGNVSELRASNLKPKDLCLIPFRVAIVAQGFATVSSKEILQCADYLKLARETQDWRLVEQVEALLRIWSQWAFLDSWWVRSVIIWAKPNPMPESVGDRPTESHEYILMLTKSAKYYWDQEAVREQGVTLEGDKAGHRFGGNKNNEPNSMTCHSNKPGKKWDWTPGRNLRSVWTFPTQPYPEAHFAVFPENLPELCIKAATPEIGCCSKCGAPWERITEKYQTAHDGTTKAKGDSQHNYKRLALVRQHLREHGMEVAPAPQTLGWQPTCKCDAEKVPSVVLDPFMGAGTTLWVAKKLNRRAVGYEISEEYCQLAVDRCWQQVMI